MKVFVFITTIALMVSCICESKSIPLTKLQELESSVYSDSFPPKKYLENPDDAPKKFLTKGMILGEELLDINWKEARITGNNSLVLFKGVVIDKESQERFSGVDVFVGTVLEEFEGDDVVIKILYRTTTDDSGGFSIKTHLDDDVRLGISFVSYRTTVYEISKVLN